VAVHVSLYKPVCSGGVQQGRKCLCFAGHQAPTPCQ
jgi:hypothetical protein